MERLMEQVTAYLIAQNRPNQIQDLPNCLSGIDAYPEVYLRVIFTNFNGKLEEFPMGNVFMNKLITVLRHFNLLPSKFTQPTLDMSKLHELHGNYLTNSYYQVSSLALMRTRDAPVRETEQLLVHLEDLIEEIDETEDDDVYNFINLHARTFQRLYLLSVHVFYETQVDYLGKRLQPLVQARLYEPIKVYFQQFMTADYERYLRQMIRFCLNSEQFREQSDYQRSHWIDARFMDYLVSLGLFDSGYPWQDQVQRVARESRPLPTAVQVDSLGDQAQLAARYLFATSILPSLEHLNTRDLFELVVGEMIKRANENVPPGQRHPTNLEPLKPLELRSMIVLRVLIRWSTAPLWRQGQNRIAQQ